MEEAGTSPDEDGLCLGGCVEDAPIGNPNARAAALACAAANLAGL